MKVLAAVLIALLAFTQRVDGQFDGIIHNIAKSTLCENQYNGCEDSFECCVSLLRQRQRKALIDRVSKCAGDSGVGFGAVFENQTEGYEGGGPTRQQKLETMTCMQRDQLANVVLNCVFRQRRRC